MNQLTRFGAPPPADPAAGDAPPGGLTPRQKAAVIVRLLLSAGAQMPLSALPEDLQAALTEQIGQMRAIDRGTLDAVIAEFQAAIDDLGLSFPEGIDGALSILDGHISSATASRLRRMSGADARADPWERLAALPSEQLLPVLERESVEIGAVMLSKLPVSRAAELLGKLPGERARRVAYAVSLTAPVAPETVRRIGLSLASQLDAAPPRAFTDDPVDRIGAILNVSAALTREEILRGLDETDAAFAEQVRRAIFTYANIPTKVEPRDIPKIVREVDQPILVTAMAAEGAEVQAATEFILANMSQRMATALRDEITDRGKVKPKEAEEAMSSVISSIRALETAGEIVLLQPEGEEE